MNARRWVLALAGIVIFTGAWFVARRASPGRPPRSVAAATRPTTTLPLHEAWPAGVKLTYRFAWQSETVAPVSAQEEAGGGLDLDGELVVRGLGGEGDASLLGVSLQPRRRHALVVLGRDLVEDERAAQALFDHEAFVSLGRDGAVRSLWFPKDAPPMWRELMVGALSQVSVHLPLSAATEWKLEELVPAGRVESRYHVSDGPKAIVEREHLRYQTLTVLQGRDCDGCAQQLRSHSALSLAADGPIDSVDADEQLVVTQKGGARLTSSRDHLELTLVKREPFSLGGFVFDASKLDARDPNAPPPRDDVDAKLLASRVNGLTWGELETTLAVHARAVSGAPPTGFVARASGLLIRHPELCAKVARIAEEAKNGRGRALALDLLTSASHAHAQAALRTALAAPSVKADPAYPMYVQRLSFLPRPEQDTARFLFDLRDRAPTGSPLSRATTYALGSLVGGLRETGQDALARRFNDRLRDDLRAARSSADEKAILAAMGNARLPENDAVLLTYTQAEDVSVREQAAYALRGSSDPDARTQLVALVSDPEASVGAASLSALDGPQVSAGELAAIARLVTEQKTPADLDATLVGFLAVHANSGSASATAATALRAMLARATDARVRGRIQLVLDQIGQLGG